MVAVSFGENVKLTTSFWAWTHHEMPKMTEPQGNYGRAQSSDTILCMLLPEKKNDLFSVSAPEEM